MRVALLHLNRMYLTERPLRICMTMVGIALGVAVVVAIRTANLDVLESFTRVVNAVAGRSTLQVSGGELGLDERLIRIVRTHPDVVEATPVLSIGGIGRSGEGDPAAIHLVGLDLLEVAEVKELQFTGEEQPEQNLNNLLDPQAVFVGRDLADTLKIRTGDSFKVAVGTTQHELVVRGMLQGRQGTSSVWNHMAIMDIASAQALFGAVGRLDRIDVVTRSGQSVDHIAQALRAALPPGVVVQRPTHRNKQVERMIRAFQLNLGMLSTVGLLVGLLLVYNTVAHHVVQRRHEIGLLRALGMQRHGVVTLFMSEAAVLGALGGCVGAWFGMGFAQVLVSFLRVSVSELYVPLPGGDETVGQSLSTMVFLGGVLGVVVSMLGALGPSLEAGRTEPARALAPGSYHEVQGITGARLAWSGGGVLVFAFLLAQLGPVQGLPLFGYASAFAVLLGLSLLSPALLLGIGQVARSSRRGVGAGVGPRSLAKLAADQVGRASRRNAVTVSALMVGIAIMVGVGIMIHSFRQTVEDWIGQTIMADIIVAPAGWPTGLEGTSQIQRIPMDLVEALVDIQGVGAVDSYRTMSITIQGQPASLVARNLRVHARWSRYVFVDGDSSEILLRTAQEGGVLLSEVLAAKHDVEVGEAVTLMTPSGTRHFQVMGIFYDYATDGGKVVMDRELYQQVWDDPTTDVIPIYFTPGVLTQEVRGRIQQAFISQGGLTFISNADIKEEILDIFDRTFSVTYALHIIAVTIALLGIANTVLTSVLERRRELATLRAIGASRAQIRWLVLWETAYLGLVGAVQGVVAGLLMALLLVEVINRQSFGWSIRLLVPPGLLVEAAVLAIVAAVLAGLGPAVWAGRQPVVEGLRYE